MKKSAFFIILSLVITLLIPAYLSATTRGIRVTAKTGQSLYLYKNYHALVVGVSDYEKWPMLPNAVNDAKEVASKLKELGFEVKLVVDPTSREMKTVLNEMVYEMGREVNRALLFYYAGHGETETLADKTKMGYIIPKDCPILEKDPLGFATHAISMRDIESASMRIKSKHVLMLFDSCFSGSLFALVRAVPHDITEKSSLPVRQYITAGREDEQVPDKSMFKRCLLIGLEGDADLTGDGYITGSELGMYLSDKVVNYTHRRQHPQYGKINNPDLDRGDFIFVPHKRLKYTERKAMPKSSSGDAESRRISEEIEKLRREKEKLRLEKELLIKERAKIEQERRELEKLKAVTGEREKLEVERKRLDAEKVKTEIAKVLPETKYKSQKTFTNSLGMTFVYILPGTFMMGGPPGEPHSWSQFYKRTIPATDEKLHQVTLTKGFFMQTTEVSQGQWYAVMGTRPWRSGERPRHYVYNNAYHPAVFISWNDCQKFIGKLNHKEGVNKYRLPTEAEWEYACRAGSNTRFQFGESGNAIGDYAWYWKNTMDVGEKYAHRVGSKRSNAFGLYDMLGNVDEWCQDWYGSYPSGNVTDPKGASSDSGVRVRRGGSFADSIVRYSFRSARRNKNDPESGFYDIGFRLVREP